MYYNINVVIITVLQFQHGTYSPQTCPPYQQATSLASPCTSQAGPREAPWGVT